MIKNYFKIAWRNLMKNKVFSFINIAGLSIGISVCFIIMLYVQDELSYDKFNNNADRIVRIIFNASINGGKISESSVMPPVAQGVTNDFPEVQDATRLMQYGTSKITYKDKTFKDDEVAFVDPNFFSVFTLPFKNGNANTALLQPNTIVITKEVAKRYFGNEEPIGKTLGFNNNKDLYKVTGVIDKVPANSHFHFAMFASLKGWGDATSDSWMRSGFYTYLLMKPGADYKKLQAKLPGMVEKYMGPQIQKEMGLSLSQFRTKGNQLGFTLQPLTSIHLYSDTTNEIEPGGNAMYVYIFGAIAIFMLLIACINFINLSTAGASKRAKEVAVRKVIGSLKFDLIKQFLLESAVLVFIGLLISYALVQIVLPVFNAISGKNLSFGFNLKIISGFTGLGLLVSIIAGVYPAFFLSSFQPIAVLKGKFTPSNKSFSLRSGLVVFQFFISVGLIISTIVVWQQMKFIQQKKLGYDKEQLVVLQNSWALGKNEKVYKEMLLNDPRIVKATISPFKPAGPSDKNNSLSYPKGHDEQALTSVEYHVDDQYIPTLGMQMVAGRNFSQEFPTDSTGIIINESAARVYGWSAMNAVGKVIIRQNSERGTNIPYHVIGVVKDFNFKSLHQPISPLLMTLQPGWGLIFKINTADIQGLLGKMKTQWDKFNTGESFTYAFMDDLYNETYSAEQKTGTILNIFAILTVFVACLGLFGLATYTAEQRTKEIGIRKVLGASVTQVTGMLSKDFIKLVFIACLIAFPLSYWAMSKWLQSFAFRININWWVFVLAAVAALLIALITVSFQAIKAAIANPVKSLRTE